MRHVGDRSFVISGAGTITDERELHLDVITRPDRAAGRHRRRHIAGGDAGHRWLAIWNSAATFDPAFDVTDADATAGDPVFLASRLILCGSSPDPGGPDDDLRHHYPGAE